MIKIFLAQGENTQTAFFFFLQFTSVWLHSTEMVCISAFVAQYLYKPTTGDKLKNVRFSNSGSSSHSEQYVDADLYTVSLHLV